MYCLSRLCDPFTLRKQLSHVIPSKLFRPGVIRVGSAENSGAKHFRGCNTGIFGLQLFANPRFLHRNFEFVREKSVQQKNFIAAQIRPLKRINSGFLGSREKCCSAMGVANEEGVARRFWIRFKNESVRAMYNPFVVALAAGTLNIESFRHYIAQDAYFLKAFAQAYTMAEDCADDDDAKTSICELRKAVEEELKLHNSLAEV